MAWVAPTQRSTSSTARGNARGVLDQQAPLLGVLLQGQQAVAQQLGRGVVAGQQQEDRRGAHLGVAPALDAEHDAQQVVARLLSVPLDLLGEIGLELADGALHLAPGLGPLVAEGEVADDRVRPAPEVLVVLRGDAEHLGDDDDRDLGEVRQLEALPAGQRPEQVGDDLADARFPAARQLGRRELAGQRLAQAAVVGPVHRDHGGRVEPEEDLGAHDGEAGAPIGEHLGHVVVAGNHPGVQGAVPDHAPGGPDLLEARKGIGDDRGIREIHVHAGRQQALR